MKGDDGGRGRPAWESLRRVEMEAGRGKTGLEAGVKAEVVVRTAMVEASAKLGL